MLELQNPGFPVGSVELSPDGFVDLATDVMTEPQVKHLFARNQSHGDTLADDANVINVVDPDCGPVLQIDSPILCKCEIAGTNLAAPLTNVGNAA